MQVKGDKVVSRDGKLTGTATGETRQCQLEGCRGRQIAVRWEDGSLTYPCTKVMSYAYGTWRIF